MITDAKRNRNLLASNKSGHIGDAGDPAIISEMKASSDALRGKLSLAATKHQGMNDHNARRGVTVCVICAGMLNPEPRHHDAE